MKTNRNDFYANLFYSYSHKDARYRQNMEDALAQLRTEGLLQEWSDLNIPPGRSISEKIREKMDESDIFVFLLSPDFIGSYECMKEWRYAQQLSAEGKLIFRIPIILRDCSWQDLLSKDDVKALPNDGKPVANFDSEDTAWLQVYEGIKAVVNQLRKTCILKPEFRQEMERTEFLSLQHVKLQDIFVFPTLLYHPLQPEEESLKGGIVKNQTELLGKKYVLIHGEEMSGKTAFGRHLFLSLVADKSTPVLYLDFKEVTGKADERIFSRAYYRQFSGDYSLWKQQENKTLILDDLSSRSNHIELIELAKGLFEKIIITLPSDTFYSFFRDETRLADFQEVEIRPLTQSQQETLIRKRLSLSDRVEPITDGFVDQIERHVNSIIISNKIVPRYPFFVLSILQTYEGFMPDNLSITAYGHCYHVLIVASLVKSGISSEDNAINASFNFAENLAFKIYQTRKLQAGNSLDLKEFVDEYNEIYVIPESIFHRLQKDDYGIINSEGYFRTPFMYYFFLGRFFAKNAKEHKAIIEEMCAQSYVSSNYLTLLFIIHHTNDDEIIDDILLWTLCALDTVEPAKLDPHETSSFKGFVDMLPESILSDNSVEDERKRERQDINEYLIESENDMEEQIDEDPINDIYRILKNNEIVGQILRNKYGSLERLKIKEVIEIVADSGLRLVKLSLGEEYITDTAHYIHQKYPDHDLEKIKRFVQFFSFIWTMVNIEKIVGAVNVPEIKEIVQEVVQQKSIPAYDLIGYFNHLDSVKELTDGVRQELRTLLKKHSDFFLRRVLSMRTQHYMNTHRSSTPIEQSICSLLEIEHSHRPSRRTT